MESEQARQTGIQLAADPLRPEMRVIFDRVEMERESDGMVRVRCHLRLGDAEFVGEALCESGEPMLMRATAAATLAALDNASEIPTGLRLVGIKQIRAFDTEIVIVSIWTSETPARHLIGSVPVTSRAIDAAAMAVLDSSNRFVAYLLKRVT